MGGACSTYGETRGIYRILMGKPERKRPLGRPWRKLKIISRWFVRKRDVGFRVDLSGSG
jgi:hypothetical protein